MKTIVLLGLLLLSAVVQADSTRFIDADVLLDEAVMNWDEVLRDNTWPYHRTSYDGTQENSRIFMNLLNVRDSIGAGMEISAIVCSVWCTYIQPEPSTAVNSGPAGIFRLFKPYVAHQMSQTRWNHTAAYEWGTIRCENASDAGSDNSSDGSGYDRSTSAADTVTVTAANAWYTFNVPPAWEDADGGFRFMIRYVTAGDSTDFRLANEHGTGEDYAARHPRAWVYYSEAEEPPAPSVHRWFGTWYGRLGQ